MTELMSIWIIGKILFLVAFFIYVIFAGVVVRQVYLMTQTLEAGFETEMRTAAWALFFLSIAVFIFTLIFL